MGQEGGDPATSEPREEVRSVRDLTRAFIEEAGGAAKYVPAGNLPFEGKLKKIDFTDATDRTGVVDFDELAPDTQYFYALTPAQEALHAVELGYRETHTFCTMPAAPRMVSASLNAGVMWIPPAMPP